MLFIVWADSCSAAGDFCYVTNVNGIVKKIMIARHPNVVGKARLSIRDAAIALY